MEAEGSGIVDCGEDKMKLAAVGCHKMETNPDDKVIGRRLRMGIVNERSSVNAVRKYLKPGEMFVNAGANIGYFTLIMAKTVGPGGEGYAFEPEPMNFGIMKRNVELNGYKNIILEEIALGDFHGHVDLSLNDTGNKGDHRIWHDPKKPKEQIKVKITMLDKYFLGKEDEVDFIKMDVQGAEANVFNGMQRILKESRPRIMMEFWPWGLLGCGSSPIKMIMNLLDFGYVFFDIVAGGNLQEIDILKESREKPWTYRYHKNVWLTPER